MIRSIMTGVLILSAVAGGNAQVEDRPLRRPPSLLRPSGPPAARVETFIPVGPDSLDATYYIPPFAPPDSNGYPAMLFHIHIEGLPSTGDNVISYFLTAGWYKQWKNNIKQVT